MISTENERTCSKRVRFEITSTKLLGLTIANDLTWNDHVTEITKKANKRLLFPNPVKESGSSETRSSTVLCFVREICYRLCSICLFQRCPPVLKERAGTAREKSNIYNNLRKVHFGKIEKGVTPILEHHYLLCSRLFDDIVSDPNHKLKAVLPLDCDNSRYNLDSAETLICTNRTSNTFISIYLSIYLS